MKFIRLLKIVLNSFSLSNLLPYFYFSTKRLKFCSMLKIETTQDFLLVDESQMIVNRANST